MKAKRLKRMAAGVQFGVLPFQVAEDGAVQILLMTSRETHRWVVPKGWPMSKRTPAEAAMQEAWEEAGLIGRMVGEEPIGSYRYQKRLGPTISVPCRVKMFLFAVEQQAEDWPERAERQTAWFEPREAAAMVEEAALAKMMLKIGAKLRRIKNGEPGSAKKKRGGGRAKAPPA